MNLDTYGQRMIRRTDPVTSAEAAEKALSFKARHEASIYACLKDHGPQICEQISEKTGLDAVAVARRMAAMEGRKLIARDGRDVNRRGNGVTRWRAV